MKKSHIKIILRIMVYFLEREIHFGVPDHLGQATPSNVEQYYQNFFRTICKNLFAILNSEAATAKQVVNFGLTETGLKLSQIIEENFLLTNKLPPGSIFFRVTTEIHDNNSDKISRINSKSNTRHEFNIFITETDTSFTIQLEAEVAADDINYETTLKLLNNHIEQFAAHLAYSNDITCEIYDFVDEVRRRSFTLLANSFIRLAVLDPGFRMPAMGSEDKKLDSALADISECISDLGACKIIFDVALKRIPRYLSMIRKLTTHFGISELDLLLKEITSFDPDDTSFMDELSSAIAGFFKTSNSSYIENLLSVIQKPTRILPNSRIMRQVLIENVMANAQAIRNLQLIRILISFTIPTFKDIHECYLNRTQPSRIYYDLACSLNGLTIANFSRSIMKLEYAYFALIEDDTCNKNVFISIKQAIYVILYSENLEFQQEKLDNEETLKQVKHVIDKFDEHYNYLQDLLKTPSRCIAVLKHIRENFTRNQNLSRILNFFIGRSSYPPTKIIVQMIFESFNLRNRRWIKVLIKQLDNFSQLANLTELEFEASQLLPQINYLKNAIAIRSNKKSSNHPSKESGENISIPKLNLGSNIEDSCNITRFDFQPVHQLDDNSSSNSLIDSHSPPTTDEDMSDKEQGPSNSRIKY